MMKNKKDIKIGALAGIIGFFLIFIFGYLTGYFDWRLAAAIGIGCFCGGVLGSMLRRLKKAGEGRKATMITTLIIVSFFIIINLPPLIEKGFGTPWWRGLVMAVLVIGWFGLLVEIFKKR